MKFISRFTRFAATFCSLALTSGAFAQSNPKTQSFGIWHDDRAEDGTAVAARPRPDRSQAKTNEPGAGKQNTVSHIAFDQRRTPASSLSESTGEQAPRQNEESIAAESARFSDPGFVRYAFFGTACRASLNLAEIPDSITGVRLGSFSVSAGGTSLKTPGLPHPITASELGPVYGATDGTSSKAAGIPDSVMTGFTISGASTTAQTLGPASGETGTITSTGSLTVSGSTVAVTISGNNSTLTNLGTLKQTGTGRAIRDNTGVTGLLINNGSTTNSTALMQTADADVIQMNKSPASVTLNNYGTMTSLNASKGGAQAVDFNAIQSGSNIINNFGTGVMQARDADAVRPGVNGVVTNAGIIKSTVTTDTGSDGIDAQNNAGVNISNSGSGLVEGARHGITGGAVDNTVNFTMGITNGVGATIQGDNGSGINIDGFNANEVVTINNGGTITGNSSTGDGDGVDVDGLVSLTNTGTIKSLNSFGTGAASEGVTVGGGTITNSGTIEGDVAAGNTTAVGRGITLAGVDTSGTPEPIYGNSIVTNQNGGLIKGQNDSAIIVLGAASGFTVTINNNAGATIEGGGATAAAIQTGADNDTINNSGTIIADSSGKAIDMGAGNDVLNITGGTAAITGNASGGTGTNSLTIDPGSNQSFSYAGSFSNFSSAEVKSGTVTLSGANTYTGATLVSGGTLALANSSGVALSGTSSVTLNNSGTLLFSQNNQINPASPIALNGGTINAGGKNQGTGGTGIANPGSVGLGALTLTSSATIDLSSISVLHFAASNGNAWTGVLSIFNWNGTPTSGGGLEQILFGLNPTGLTLTQLDQIQFINPAGFDPGTYGAIWASDGTGEVVPLLAPVPEPSSWLAAALALGAIVWTQRKRMGNWSQS